MSVVHELATATRIVFGDGSIARLPAIPREVAGGDAGARVRAMVVTGASSARHGAVFGALDAVGLECVTFAVARGAHDRPRARGDRGGASPTPTAAADVAQRAEAGATRTPSSLRSRWGSAIVTRRRCFR